MLTIIPLVATVPLFNIVKGQGNNESINGPEVEVCDNGKDDDGDGLKDGKDSDCALLSGEQEQPADEQQQQQQEQQQQEQLPADEQQQQQQSQSTVETCDNGVDDNGDGQIDEGCALSPSEPTQPTSEKEQQTQAAPEELCGNRVDDNGDGAVNEACLNATIASEQQPAREESMQSSDAVPSTKRAEPNQIPLGSCVNNETGCNPSAEPNVIPSVVNQCPDNETGCSPSAEAKLNSPILCQANESECGLPEAIGTNPKLTDCFNQTSTNQDCTIPSQERPVQISDCPFNENLTHCLPPAGISPTNFHENNAPAADAGKDQEVDEKSLVTLDGTKSHDYDGNITSYSWVQTGGDESVTISDADSAHPSFYAPRVTSDTALTFELTVFDDMGYATSDDVDVFIKNVDDSAPLPINGSIRLNPIPNSLEGATIYKFKGQLAIDGLTNYDGKYIRIVDGAGESEDPLSFGKVEKDGLFDVEWTTVPRNSSYNIYAVYNDENNTEFKSDEYQVMVNQTEISPENITSIITNQSNLSNDTRIPFIPINFNNYATNKINVYVKEDDLSKDYVPVVKNAIDRWSQVLQERSGNKDAWKFNFFTTEKFPNLNLDRLSQQFGFNPSNILIKLRNDIDKDYCKEGTRGIAHNLVLQRLFKNSITIQVFTGCGGKEWSSDKREQDKEVSRIASHEFAHALGLGHTWQELGDMMCSSDYLQTDFAKRFAVTYRDALGQIAPGLLSNLLVKIHSCEGAPDKYPDDENEPSNFDIGAMIYSYGNDGFGAPNRRIFSDTVFRCDIEPKLCEPSKQYQDLNFDGTYVKSPYLEDNQREPSKFLETTPTKRNNLNSEQGNNIKSIDAPSAFQSYGYKNLGVTLKHPRDWKVVNLKNGIQLVKEKNRVYLEIRGSNSQPSNKSLKQFVNDDIKERFSSRKDFRLLNLSQTIISGNLPAYKTVYVFLKTQNQKVFTNEDTSKKVLRITTFANDNAYIVKYVSDKNKYDSYLPIAQKIIDSLKINAQEINSKDAAKTGKSYQLIVYLDGASQKNSIGDNFKIVVYNSDNETILSAKPTIDFNDNHQKISPKNGYPINYAAGANPKDFRVCAQQEYSSNGRTYLHDDCYPIKQNVQKTYWYTIFDYGEIDGFGGGD
jgi:hypothetical protein